MWDGESVHAAVTLISGDLGRMASWIMLFDLSVNTFFSSQTENPNKWTQGQKWSLQPVQAWFLLNSPPPFSSRRYNSSWKTLLCRYAWRLCCTHSELLFADADVPFPVVRWQNRLCPRSCSAQVIRVSLTFFILPNVSCSELTIVRLLPTWRRCYAKTAR